MRFMIIGGAGLLGTRLAPTLVAMGHEVALCDNFSGSVQYRTPSDHRIFTANAGDLNALQHAFAAYKPEAIVVAPAYVCPRDVVYTFYEDTRTVLDSANVIAFLLNRSVKHVYFCSSHEVYGGPQSRKPLKETRKITHSSNNHGTAKLAAERFLGFRCKELDIPYTVLRIFDMFGPRIVFSPLTGVVNFLIDGFLKREMLGLVGATHLRDFVHVDDVVGAITRLVKVGFTGTVNIGTGKGTSLRELAAEIGKAIPMGETPIELPDGRLPTFSSVANVSVLDSAFPKGWRPRHDVLSSIPKLVEFRRGEIEFYSRSNPLAVLNAMRGIESA